MITAFRFQPRSNEEWAAALSLEVPGAGFHPLTHVEQPRVLVVLIAEPMSAAQLHAAEGALVAALRALLPRRGPA